MTTNWQENETNVQNKYPANMKNEKYVNTPKIKFSIVSSQSLH